MSISKKPEAREKMTNSKNAFQKLESYFKKDAITVDMNSTQAIKNKGLYKLDEESFFLLIPNFMDDTSNLENCCQNLKFKKKSQTRQTFYIGPTYEYSNIKHDRNDLWPEDIVKTKGFIEYQFGIPVNSVLINKYESGDFIPFHKDNEACLGPDPVIFSLSTGEKGIMTIIDNNNNMVDVVLYPGSLLVMGGKFNDRYKHKVDRPSTRKTRLNFTFRYIYDISTNQTTSCDSNSLDEIKNLVSTLSKEIKDGRNEIAEMKKQINVDRTKKPDTKLEQHQSNLRVVVVKEASLPQELCTKELILQLLNEKLSAIEVTEATEEDKKPKELQLSDINEVVDKRKDVGGKLIGPIFIDFNSKQSKIDVLKNIKKTDETLIYDYLDRNTLKLRKEAISLKDKNMISEVWVYRGNIYCTLPNRRGSSRVTWDLVRVLSNRGRNSSRR